FAKYGLEKLVMVIHNDYQKNILLGKPERDREIDNICKSLEAMGKVGLDTLGYDLIFSLIPPFAKHPGYWRNPNGRGGAVLTAYDHEKALAEMDAPAGKVTAEEGWERIRYLYKHTVPVAESAKVNLACHPDDPPMPLYRGVEQILNTVAGLKKLTEEVMPSPRNGLLFCIGTITETGANIYEATEYFLKREKIFITHFRNVRGTIPKYNEVFIDEGDNDMYRLMKLYVKYDHQGIIVPDHAVGMVNDTRWGHISRAWSMGHILALKQAAETELAACRAKK
ncbi:MAG: mannonate dehydratase, partial [Chloroflexota bacterium]|nr:mannonate dehydratase [Chloroflexota bacterium]